MKPHIVKTESGRIVRLSLKGLDELVDGEWVKPSASVSGEAFMMGHPLSAKEAAQIVRDAKTNPAK